MPSTLRQVSIHRVGRGTFGGSPHLFHRQVAPFRTPSIGGLLAQKDRFGQCPVGEEMTVQARVGPDCFQIALCLLVTDEKLDRIADVLLVGATVGRVAVAKEGEYGQSRRTTGQGTSTTI